MKKLLLVVYVYVASLACLHAQDLTTVNEACPGQLVQFNSPLPAITGTAQYDWDFCTGDLLLTPKGSLVSSTIDADNIIGTGVQRPEGMDIVFDNGNWYGFITNRGMGINFALVRVDFGNSLDNVPIYKNIGNPNNVLNQPRAIKVVKHNTNWYAVIANINGPNELVVISFGATLNNDTPTGIAYPTSTANPEGLDVHKEDGKLYIAIAHTAQPGNFKAITIVDFGVDFSNTPVELYTFATNLSYGNAFHHGKVDFIWDSGNLYCYMAGTLDPVNNITRFNFGNSIVNTPTAIAFPTYIPNKQLYSLDVVREGENYYLFGLVDTGEFFRVSFGNSLNNTPATATAFGNLGILGKLQLINRPSVHGQMVKDGSSYSYFAINRRNELNLENQLVKLKFPNLCNVIPSVSTMINPSAIFLEAGVQQIGLTVSDNDGFSLYHYGDNILIKQAIIGEFSYDGQCLGAPIVFNNLSRGAESNLQSWEWTFGDGQTSNQKQPNHLYTQAGRYDIKLKVNNLSGCTNEVVKSIRISSRPKADFIIKNIDCANKTVEIQDLSDLPASDKSLGGEIRNRVWLFGDGSRWVASPYTATTYSKTYATNGSFTITLTVTDETGCSSSVSKQISLLPTNSPTANFNFSNACVGVPTKFLDNSTLPTGSIGVITGWQWTFLNVDGTNVMANSTLAQPNFTYTTTGNYTVKLRVRNSLGCSAEVSKIINVKESLNSDFNASVLAGSAPLTVNFTNLTTGASSYAWDFGNGEVSTATSPTHIFKQEGVYVINFQANNANGCGKIATRTVIVEQTTANEPLAPIYKFSIYPNPAHDFLFIEFPITPSNNAFCRLTDMAGKIVLERTVNLRKNSITVAHLPAGMYIVHLTEGKNIGQIKIIKYK